MLAYPNDTSPDAERVQYELLSRATPEQKIDLLNMLIKGTRELAWQGLQQAHPEATEAELDYLWLKINYGAELADRVRDHLTKRRQK